MEDLKSWLKNPRDYEQGRRLYDIYGKNGNLKRLFKRRTPYTIKQLQYELERLSKVHITSEGSSPKIPPKTTIKSGAIVQKPAPIKRQETGQKHGQKSPENIGTQGFSPLSERKKPLYTTKGWPRDLQQLDVKKGALNRERSYYHNRLEDIKDRKERFKACRVIVRNTAEINRIWHILDTYHELKINLLKESLPRPLPDDKAQLKLELVNRVRPHISKLKKKIDTNPKSPKLKDWQQQLSELLSRQTEIENKINEGE